ncbi:MAG: 50S ribosomal protein L29 [Granulosicoccus sp.]
MAESKTSELTAKSVEELSTELGSLFREQFNLRMQRGSGQDVKPHNFKRVRRQIARIKTIINQKQSAGA